MPYADYRVPRGRGMAAYHQGGGMVAQGIEFDELYEDPRRHGLRSRAQDREIHDLQLRLEHAVEEKAEKTIKKKQDVDNIIAYFYSK